MFVRGGEEEASRAWAEVGWLVSCFLYQDLPAKHSQYTIDTKNSGTDGWWA